MSEALIVIDVQEDFFAHPKKPVFREEYLIENINRLIAHFRKKGDPIIFVQHEDEDLKKNTVGWKVDHRIHSDARDKFVVKTTPDAFFETELSNFLQKEAVNAIFIAGLQTDYCIDTTCRSAFGKSWKTTLISDAHSTYDNDFMKAEDIISYHNHLIGSWFAALETTEEISK